MIVGLNASQARAKSNQDLLIYTESYNVMNEIITASGSGLYEVTVSDKSTMTDATPTVVKQGIAQNPIVAPGDTVIIMGSTITLGTSGTNLNAVVADINDAAVAGVTASKDSGYLILTIVLPQNNWVYEIGAGTANAALGLVPISANAPAPDSTLYYQVWQGTLTDRAKQTQMDEVIRYFENLGFKIQRRQNTTSLKTFDWYIYW